MKKYKKATFLLLMICIYLEGFSQDKTSDFPPYTIESIYQKLNKKYPFITPISPIISEQIIAKENVIYKNINGQTLKADIYIPKRKSKRDFPAVLLIHGGGWLTGSKENQRIMAQNLALNGYVAITVSYQLGFEAPYPAAVLDLKDALIWMRENADHYHINPDKIAVLGASAGGHLATLIGVTPNLPIYDVNSTILEKVQAIVNIDGIVSFIHHEAASEGKMASIWLNGSKENNYRNWKEASPLEYVNATSPPILFINSSQPRFHAGRDDMISILNKHGIYNQTFTIPNSPHSFWLMQPWFDITLNLITDFLNTVLKDN